MPFRNQRETDDDYTPQERLTAAVMEYKKLEAANQTAIERMYGALSSPFKVSNRPCEIPRAAVMQCFEKIMGKTTLNHSSNDDDSNNNPVGNENSVGASSRFPAVHHCYDAVIQYETCVLDKALAQHHDLVAGFEARRAKESEMAGEAVADMAANSSRV